MRKRVLIVDDENFVRLLLRRTLEDCEFNGVEIAMAEDGIQGVESARVESTRSRFSRPHDAGMDGVEVCSALRRDPHLADTHIVLLTAKSCLIFQRTRSPMDV